MWVHDLRSADGSCGGKAAGLARLIAAGLDVPSGFVISDAAFRSVVGELAAEAASVDTAQLGHVLSRAAETIASAQIPADLEREVIERAKELGSLVAVRSSATIEDTAAGSAAGVFSSRRAVPPAEVWNAIRAVWTSALTPLAAAYARRHATQSASGLIAIGVIVQEFVAGTPIVVYTRPPGHPESPQILVQRGDHVSRHARDDLPREIETQHAALLALRAERVLGSTTGVDVELVQIRKQSGFDVALETSIVQARPIIHPVPRNLVSPPRSVLSSLLDGRTWTWDIAHNPDPLSLAQQGLVERVDAAGLSPYSLRVCSGFLYSAARGEPLPAPPTVRELQLRGAELEARLEKTLKHDEGELSVSEAVERYLAFYAIWARELSPLVASARSVLPSRLRARGDDHAEHAVAALIGPRVSVIEAALLAGARGELEDTDVERALGFLAPAWDICVATFGEQPGLLRDAVARARTALPTIATRAESVPCLPDRDLAFEIELARCAAELAERDDVLFARAQLLVRRALLAHAARLGIAGDDVFWLPLEEVAGASTMDPIDTRRRASAARAAADRAARWQMPIVVGEEVGEATSAAPTLRGQGTGPRVAGRVVRFGSLATAIAVGAGDVVVTRAVTPALAVLVAGCAALVSETGGLLDHGAALARELGIPCVVGCRDAWTALADGMLVTVDGDGGTVTTYASSSS